MFLRDTKIFLKRHERVLMPLTLIFGFIVDYLTLNRVDQIFDNLVLFFYVVLGAFSLHAIYAKKHFFETHSVLSKYYHFLPFILQYAIGGLFSGLMIFYFRSGNILTSLPFILVLFILMLGNEYFYKRFPKLTFQLTVFYIALLAYCNLLLPVLLKQMGVFIFLTATLIASFLMYGYIIMLNRVSKDVLTGNQRRTLEIRLATTLLIFITLYFTNIIPPIPLSMKEGIVAHDVTKNTQGDYEVVFEASPWYKPFTKYNTEIHTTESVFVFGSIFAPTRLKTNVYHQWSYYSDDQGWIDTDRIPIPITGGRDAGYRGFSQKQNVQDGLWRVDIETSRKQIIGRITFRVDRSGQETQRIKEIY